MTDKLEEAGRELKALRAESSKLRTRLEEVRQRLGQLRPEIQALIIQAARDGRRQSEIRELTGYDREHIRKTLRAAGIEPTE